MAPFTTSASRSLCVVSARRWRVTRYFSVQYRVEECVVGPRFMFGFPSLYFLPCTQSCPSFEPLCPVCSHSAVGAGFALIHLMCTAETMLLGRPLNFANSSTVEHLPSTSSLRKSFQGGGVVDARTLLDRPLLTAVVIYRPSVNVSDLACFFRSCLAPHRDCDFVRFVTSPLLHMTSTSLYPSIVCCTLFTVTSLDCLSSRRGSLAPTFFNQCRPGKRTEGEAKKYRGGQARGP